VTTPETTPAPEAKGSRGKIVGLVAGLVIVVAVAGLAVVRGDLFSSEPPRPADPFENTPAAQFVSGADALELPPATEVPGFTVDQVAAALQNVKAALVAGRMDEAMLVNHDRTAFDALFSDYGLQVLDQLEVTNTMPIVATRIAEGQTLADYPVRFSGEITFAGDTLENGIRVLVVRTAFVWVYAFSGELQRPGDHLVTVRDSVEWIFPEESEVDPEYIGMYVGEKSQFFASGIDCALIGQGFVALGEPISVDPDVADVEGAFDPTGSWTIPDELACAGTISGPLR
jgi:hypothetical protein